MDKNEWSEIMEPDKRNDLRRYMVQLGFRESLSGTAMLRRAVELWQRGKMMTKDIYPEIAKEFGSTPSRVERSMRHAIDSAFMRGDQVLVNRIFGYGISAEKGKPTNGDFVAAMAEFVREDWRL